MSPPSDSRNPNYLPDEIVLDILSYLPRTSSEQSTLWSFCLVNRQWYNAAVARLYERPYLYGKTFQLFVRTVCPSINVHVKKSDLAGLVRILDLQHIVHQSSKSMTARLLGRTKKSLEGFVAPQASFAVNCFAALSKCTKLHTLDLSLISEAISIASLSHTLQQLPELKVLFFPRSSNDSDQFNSSNMQWPNLRELHLSGSIHGNFVKHLGNPITGECFLPPTLTTLSLTHCPRLRSVDVEGLLQVVGPQLKSLTVENIRDLDHTTMDPSLKLCPNLTFFRVSLDYITFLCMDSDFQQINAHPLERLELSCSGDTGPPGDGEMELEALDIVESIHQGFFPNLRVVRVAKSAGWHVHDMEGLAVLIDLLDENHQKRTGQDPSQRSKIAGVWTMED